MRSQPFTLTPGQAQRAIALGFWAATAIVDNPTTQPWQIDGGVVVPAFTIGVVLPLKPATQTPKVTPFTPSGYTVAVVSGQTATVTFDSRELPASPGTPYAPSTLAIVQSTLPAAQVGVAYQTTLTATGGTGALTWSATGLPAWASLAAATGSITGTPTAGSSGTATFTVTVTDAAGLTATRALSIAVNAGPDTPYLYSPANIAGITSAATPANFAADTVPANHKRKVTTFSGSVVSIQFNSTNATATVNVSLLKNGAVVASVAATIPSNAPGIGASGTCDVDLVAGDTLAVTVVIGNLAGGASWTVAASAAGVDNTI